MSTGNEKVASLFAASLKTKNIHCVQKKRPLLFSGIILRKSNQSE